MPKGREPVANAIHIPDVDTLTQRKKLQEEFVVVGEGILSSIREQDEVEGISLGDIEREVAFDHHFRCELREIDEANVVFMEIADPSQPVGKRNVKGAPLQADAMAFPGAHHQPVQAEGDFKGVTVSRPMMNVDFHGLDLGESNLWSAIESQGKIDWISRGHESSIDLIGPDFK